MEGEAAQSQSQRRSTLRTRTRSRRSRKPLFDCSNTISQSQSSPTPKPLTEPKTKPRPAAIDQPSIPRPSSPPGGDENDNIFQIPSACTRKQTSDKGKDNEKTLAIPFRSCFADRIVTFGNKRKENEDSNLLERHTAPLKKINLDAEVERREEALMEGKAAQSQRRSTLRSRNSSRGRTNPKPLSDCTNTIFQSQSQPLSQASLATTVATRSKTKPYFQPKVKPNPATLVPSTADASATNTSDPSTPLPHLRPSSPGDDGNEDVFEIRTVYTRRQSADKRKGKEKALAVPFSSYSADRIVNAGNKRNAYKDMGLLEPHTVPLKKRQRHTELERDASERALEDYIQQQRAYFDEVDAFELPEEEVGSGNDSD